MRVVLCKKRSRKQQIFENCELFKNQESKERLRPMRRLLPLQNGEFGSKIKNAKKKKHAKNDSTRTRELFCAKSAQENTKYLRIETNLKISHLSKGYSPCKGYNLCKMVSVGQKLKMPKTCKKPFYKKMRVVLWKKR